MNAEEIKKRLRSKNVNFELPKEELKRQKSEPILQSREKESSSSGKERVDHTELFGDDSEEEKEPQSKIWDAPINEIKISGCTPKEFVKQLKLDDVEYDWRRESRKGRKSRENFSKYIITVI